MNRAYPVVAALVLLLGPAGCILRKPWVDDTFSAETPANLPPLPGGPALKVLVIGDFGTRGEGQRQVAQAIAETHGEDPPDLVLTVGDNIYPKGVSSVDDPLWETTFENVYTGRFWESLVFFPALGNHDVKGSVQAQLDYSDQNPMWTMPGEYYAFRRGLPSGDSVRFLALDTNAIKEEESPQGTAQLEWVDSVLRASPNDWMIAYGHHPMETAGWHETDVPVREKLAGAFGGRVALYLAGHNHSMELLHVSDSLLQAVCGGGAGRDNAYRVGESPQTISAFSNGGWCFLRVQPEVLTVELYNAAGTLRFRRLIRAAG